VDDVRAQESGLRWVASDSWHLTLAFLGEVDEAQLADVRVRLAEAVGRHSSLSLHFAGGGRFGDRVLYTRVEGDRLPLSELAGSVTAAGLRSGLDVDDRPYLPHLTLARSGGGVDLRPLVASLASYAGPVWTADRVQLMESRRPDGAGLPPSYVVVEEWAMGGASVG
jgi:2'-5' RNA ligase